MKEKLDLYIKAAQSAKNRIKFNLLNDVFWDDVTRCIHEVPIDYEPELDTAVNFILQGKS
jgi:hypothetical protein